MAPQHNPDEFMADGDLDPSFSVESFFAEEAATPAVSAPPPTKRVCAAASSSSAPVAPPAVSRRPTAAPAAAPVAGPSNAVPSTSNSTQEVAPVPALTLTGRFLRLRRNRETVGVVVNNLARDTQSVVVILFPEALESHRSRIVTRVRSVLRGRDFAGGRVPAFEASAGELLRLPCRSYARHVFQWPSRDDAARFRGLLPITYRAADGPTAEIKVYVDPVPEFTAAKARGEPVLVIRNIPIGFATQDIKNLLVGRRTEGGARWLGDLLHFHKVFDPYEESYLPQMAGVPVAPENDPLFDAVPAVIWIPQVQEPMLVNISSHSCAVCPSNHRTRDHSSFAAVRRNRISNPFTITVGQLQHVNSTSLCLLHLLSAPVSLSLRTSHASDTVIFHPPCLSGCLGSELVLWTIFSLGLPSLRKGLVLLNFSLVPLCLFPNLTARVIGEHPAVVSFKSDPGLIFIGTDVEVEVWTCGLCGFCCGWALDSAMDHLTSSGHAAALQNVAGSVTPIEGFGDMKAHDFNRNASIAAFLA
ncbi:unnamed protein product [Closterium sp. Yama58-4]|nr:unnamed protein product [Closterium sp. Yama58-4]